MQFLIFSIIYIGIWFFLKIFLISSKLYTLLGLFKITVCSLVLDKNSSIWKISSSIILGFSPPLRLIWNMAWYIFISLFKFLSPTKNLLSLSPFCSSSRIFEERKKEFKPIFFSRTDGIFIWWSILLEGDNIPLVKLLLSCKELIYKASFSFSSVALLFPNEI